MRAGEVFGLEWTRVNLPKRFVRLAETKNGDWRDVPLSAMACGAAGGDAGHRDIRSLQTCYNETAESMARLL
jgi:integrase